MKNENKNVNVNKIIRIITIIVIATIIASSTLSAAATSPFVRPAVSTTPPAAQDDENNEDPDDETIPEEYYFITTDLEEFLATPAIPISEETITHNNRYEIIQRFSLAFDEPDVIPRTSFQRNGNVFHFDSIIRIDVDRTQRQEHSEQITIETRTSDIIDVMNALYAVLIYDDGQFVGELFLQHDSVRTVPMDAVPERRTLTDRRMYNNIAFGDISGIARSMTRNGVHLTLERVEWQPNMHGINHNVVSTTYNAIAHYSGNYTRNVIPGFYTTALYTGEIMFLDLNPDVLYEVRFISQYETPASPDLDYTIGKNLEGIEATEVEVGVDDDAVSDNGNGWDDGNDEIEHTDESGGVNLLFVIGIPFAIIAIAVGGLVIFCRAKGITVPFLNKLFPRNDEIEDTETGYDDYDEDDLIGHVKHSDYDDENNTYR